MRGTSDRTKAGGGLPPHAETQWTSKYKIASGKVTVPLALWRWTLSTGSRQVGLTGAST